MQDDSENNNNTCEAVDYVNNTKFQTEEDTNTHLDNDEPKIHIEGILHLKNFNNEDNNEVSGNNYIV